MEKVEVTNAETLAKLYEKFQEGKVCLIFAFRHAEVDDHLGDL
ncbi:hypothetical protein RintRC_0672 [Richelia intracellularis]|nr:hypothetical protein RintRC_0672 [Richelia intracellularis]